MKHPAPFSQHILDDIERMLSPYLPSPDALVLDPFAGLGKVHTLPWRTVGMDIEFEWAVMSRPTVVGDALALPFPDDCFDAVVTSPCYGNRMADHHEAKDGSYRRTYRHLLGRPLHPRSAGSIQWGEAYRAFHEAAWLEVRRVVKPGGLFLLNCKDHYRQGVRQQVCAWHRRTIESQGWVRLEEWHVPTPGFRFGANRRRVGEEMLALFRHVYGIRPRERADLTWTFTAAMLARSRHCGGPDIGG